MKSGYIYILASDHNDVLYIGVTNDLLFRIQQHKQYAGSAFAKKHNTTKLVYFEDCGDIYSALNREKHLKKWNRAWKDELIVKNNPGWRDLFNELIENAGS